jgi:hypothetical protein
MRWPTRLVWILGVAIVLVAVWREEDTRSRVGRTEVFICAEDASKLTVAQASYQKRYCVRQRSGPTGPTGASGPVSVPGVAVAANGHDGANGHNGKDGQSGAAGVDGLPGRPGATGVPGATGARGKPGRRGRPGKDGKPGKDGAPASTAQIVGVVQQQLEPVQAALGDIERTLRTLCLTLHLC